MASEAVEQISEWRGGMAALHARIAPRFGRPEVRGRGATLQAC